MKIKYVILNCTKKEGLYRVVLHVDGEKYSRDLTPYEYRIISKDQLEDDLKLEVLNILKERLELERK